MARRPKLISIYFFLIFHELHISSCDLIPKGPILGLPKKKVIMMIKRQGEFAWLRL